MMPKVDPMPIVSAPPSVMSITPSMPPLKPLPDFDADNDDNVGGEKDFMMKMGIDNTEIDGDEISKELDSEKKKDEWINEPNPEVKDIDYMVNKLAGGMNKGHDTFPKVSDGELRSQIRAELLKRLAEAKGAK